MIKLLDLLFEAKKVGILYHWTDLENLISILKSNTLRANVTEGYKGLDFRTKINPELNIKPHVSFTRMKGKTYGNNKIFALGCALEIDGDKLSNNYKIVPYSMFNYHKSKAGEYIDDYENAQYMAEYEERIYKNITNIKNYIRYIILDGRLLGLDNSFETISDAVEYIEYLGVPIKYVKETSKYNEPITKEEFYKVISNE
jgi:hypothetical protein